MHTVEGRKESNRRRFDGDPTFAASTAFVRQRHGYEFGGSVRRDPVRPMTTAVASISTVVITNTSRHPRATFRSRRSCRADGAGHANSSKL